MRTVFSAGNTSIISQVMRHYQIDVLGITEARWTGSGVCKLKTGEIIYYSGNMEDNPQHLHGTAFMLSKQTSKTILSWEPVSDRIITLRLNSNFQKTTIITVYTPTNETEKALKEAFYQKLQSVIDKTPKKDIIILMGDLNAKIGKNNCGKEKIMGKEGLG